MTDYIEVCDLAAEISIGAYDWERHVLQQIHIDISLVTDTTAAGHSDRLIDAIDYSKVAQDTLRIAKSRHFVLIESLAEEIASHLLGSTRAASIVIKVTKPGAVANATAVSVKIERKR